MLTSCFIYYRSLLLGYKLIHVYSFIKAVLTFFLYFSVYIKVSEYADQAVEGVFARRLKLEDQSKKTRFVFKLNLRAIVNRHEKCKTVKLTFSSSRGDTSLIGQTS